MPSVNVPNVPGDATELDIEYADRTNDLRGQKAWNELGWKALKTVATAGLATAAGKKVVPLSKGETSPGRAFRALAAKTVNGVRYVSKPSGFDYANQTPYTAGKIKVSFTVGEKGARVELDGHLYDPDDRPSKMELIVANQQFFVDAKPGWAELQGTALVVDTSAARASTTLAVQLTDEKGAVATLAVTFDVVAPDAPDAPGDVEYVAV